MVTNFITCCGCGIRNPAKNWVSELVDKSRNYCSLDCVKKASHKKTVFRCENCGMDTVRNPSSTRRNKTGYIYCSSLCAKGKNKDQLKLQCKHCSKTIFKNKSSIKHAKHNSFCSVECRTNWSKGKPRFYKKHVYLFRLNCEYCDKKIERKESAIKQSKSQRFFCSLSCAALYKNRSLLKIINPLLPILCSYCGDFTEKRKKQIEKSKTKNFFCNKSCACAFGRKIKKRNGLRSKAEIYLEKKFRKEYPSIPFVCNDREICDGLELDFYFPISFVAVEINGPTHYTPIFGVDKLSKSKENDALKSSICLSKKIDLVVIPNDCHYRTKGAKEKMWQLFVEALKEKVAL